MSTRHSGQERQNEDWYTEPKWATEALLRRERFIGMILDPCCGRGHVVQAVREHGIQCYAHDIVDRGCPKSGIDDWVNSEWEVPDFVARNIVFNPPFKDAQRFIELALERGYHKVCAFLPANFVYSQGRYEFFQTAPLYRIYHFSKRPSCPPGHMYDDPDFVASGGSGDFSWFVFDTCFQGTPTVHWINSIDPDDDPIKNNLAGDQLPKAEPINNMEAVNAR